MKLSDLKKGDEVVVVWKDNLQIAKISKINSRTIVVDGVKYWAGNGKQQDGLAWPYINVLTENMKKFIRLFQLAISVIGDIGASWRLMCDVGEKLDNVRIMVDDLQSIICDIRDAAGVDEKPMLSEMAECVAKLKKGHDRYEKVRKLNPQQLGKLHRQNIQYGKRFDDLVDEHLSSY